MGFHKKYDWIKLNKKNIKVVDHPFSTNGMLFNTNKIKKYNTTVMLTSINGYSDLFSQDTLKAYELLKIQKNHLLPILEDHNGISLLNIMDDKLIITFV